MTSINKVNLYNIDYSLNALIKILKEKGRYFKCKICGRKYVEKENDLCKNCRYFANLTIEEKKDSENTKS